MSVRFKTPERHIDRGNTPHADCPTCQGTGKEVIGYEAAKNGRGGAFEFRRCKTCLLKDGAE